MVRSSRTCSLALTLCVLGVGCEARPSSPTRPARKAGPFASPAVSTEGVPKAAFPSYKVGEAARWPLAIQRNRTLRFAPTEAPVRRLAFYGDNLARLTRDAVYLLRFDAKEAARDSKRARQIALDGPRELARLADNSLVVIARTSTLIVPPDDRAQATLGKVSYFPGIRLWPELRFAQAFTTVDTARGVFSTYRWQAPQKHDLPRDSTILLPEISLEQPELKDARCTLLLDGSYSCLGAAGLYHGWPGHRATCLGPIHAGATVMRLLAAERSDRVRLLRSDGRLESYWVTHPPKRVFATELPWMPLELVSNKQYIVVLTLDQTPDTSRAFRLVTLDATGAAAWRAELDSVSTAMAPEDFDRNLQDCRSLALHPTQPWLAVSDCARILLFDLVTGTRMAEVENVPY